MVTSVESCFKSELAPIIGLFLRLLTNAPRSMNVSQGGIKGVCSSEVIDEDKGMVVGRVMSTQIPNLLPMKPMMIT